MNDNLSGSRPLGVALIGLGMVAKAHARALQDLQPSLKVCGVYARSEDSRKKFLNEYSFNDTPKAYETLAQIAADDAVDMVIIITPPNARLEIIREMANAGKHILTEKPIERTTKAATEIVEICQNNNVKLGVVFQYRMRAGAKELARLIRTGQFGQLGAVEINIPWWRDQSYYDEPGRGTYSRDGGGVLISQAIHTLDLALSLAGPVDYVQSVAATSKLHKMESEDFVAAGLKFKNGAVGSLTASTVNFPGSVENIHLHFEYASAVFQGEALTVHWRDGRVETVGEPADTGGGADPMAFPHDWHRDLIADFAEAILNDKDPCVSGKVGLRVHRLIDALVVSSREQRAVHLDDDE
ncbi:MAG: oxidoreductase [Alphaproteobacteria bacterium]|nr:MAG: oxidoreductase [Alphaproteobacteria bacterium]